MFEKFAFLPVMNCQPRMQTEGLETGMQEVSELSSAEAMANIEMKTARAVKSLVEYCMVRLDERRG